MVNKTSIAVVSLITLACLVCFTGYAAEEKGASKMAAKKTAPVSPSVGRLELLASFKGKITEMIDFGDTPIGKRSDVYFEGDLTGGKISGKMRGVDYILVRSDEVSELNVRAAITTDDDVNLSVEISGYMQNNEIRDHSLKVVTGHEKYKWLTSKIVVGKGKVTPEGLEINYFYEP